MKIQIDESECRQTSKSASIISVLCAFLFLAACGEGDQSETRSAGSRLMRVGHIVDLPDCQSSQRASLRLQPNASEVRVYTGPGDTYSRAINSRATNALRRTVYRDLTPAYIVEADCRDQNWVHFEIVQADGSPVNWGWGYAEARFFQNEGYTAENRMYWELSNLEGFSPQQVSEVRSQVLGVMERNPDCRFVLYGDVSTSRADQIYFTCQSSSGRTFSEYIDVPN